MPVPLAQRQISERVAPVDTTKSQVLSAISDVAQPIGQAIINSEKLKTNNDLNDVQNEVMVFNTEFKLGNSIDPMNQESIKSYNEKVEKIYTDKRQKVPDQFLSEYDRAFSSFQSKNDSNMQIWRLLQNDKNILTDTKVGIDRDMNSAYRLGEEGNLFDAVNYFESQDDLIKQNIVGLDPQTHNQLYGSFKSDFFTNFINGSMNNNPEKTLNLLNDDQVKDSIDPDTYSKLKDATENKLINAKSLAIKKEISGKIMSNTRETRKALEGKSSYTELYNYIEQNDISKPTAEYLMKVGGYTKDKVEKVPLSEQVKAKNEMYNRIAIAEEEGDISTFEKIQNDIYSKMDNNFFSQAEGESMIDTYIVPYAEKIQDATDDYSVKRFLEFGLNVGSRGINEFVDEIPIYGKEEDIENRRASIRVSLLDSFTDELNSEVANDPQLNSIKDVSDLPKAQRINLLNNVRDRAIKNYANTFDIQTEDRPINDIKLNIKEKQINLIRNDNNKVVDEVYNRTDLRKFVAVRNNNGVYEGRTPQGNTVKITKQQYESLKK